MTELWQLFHCSKRGEVVAIYLGAADTVASQLARYRAWEVENGFDSSPVYAQRHTVGLNTPVDGWPDGPALMCRDKRADGLSIADADALVVATVTAATATAATEVAAAASEDS